MGFNKSKVATCIILVLLLLCAFASSALAAPHLSFIAQNVYYNDYGDLIIHGYFYNDGTKTIDRINTTNLYVYFRNNGSDWWLASSATWQNINVVLNPGDSHHYNLRITNPNRYQFDAWRVTGSVNYHVIDNDV